MNKKFYEDKVRGCWLGKCLGGIAGMPFEGVPYIPNLTEKSIHVKDVPNDDLEMQLIWLCGLKKYGLGLNEKAMAEIWLDHIPHGCDEYSMAQRNLRRGILPPASGWKDNFFVDGMGATIRSEIWALTFPGRPDAAGFFAQQDAQVDHWGNGVRGEIFMAMAESMACVNSDIPASLRYALSKVEKGTELHQTIGKIFALYDAGASEKDAYEYLLLHYQRHPNFTHCVMNLAIIVFALLWGKGDFMKTTLLAVNCGRDTDCTGASCGAFLGIALGEKAFPKKWRQAVKEELILSEYVRVVPGVPLTFTDLVKQTIETHEKLFPLLKKKYPAYKPYVPNSDLPSLDASEWLLLEDASNADEVEKTLLKKGKYSGGKTVRFDGLILDLSEYAHDACTLDLFTFVKMENKDVKPEDVMLSATADVGMTLWIDGKRIMNHHSRLKMLPSFHRAEGGAAFAFPLHYGDRKLIHLRLYYCLPPTKACVMFGNQWNDHLEGVRFSLGKP